MIYLQLLWSFIQVGMFSIGGGYAAIPLIQSQVVETYGWLTMSEFTDLVTIAEMTPGPISINAATFVGIRVLGIPGALVATFGCILPACFIVSLLAYVYRKYKGAPAVNSVLQGLRPAVVALITGAGISILQTAVLGSGKMTLWGISFIGLPLFAAAFFVLRKFKPNPIIVMLVCGAINLVIYVCTGFAFV